MKSGAGNKTFLTDTMGCMSGRSPRYSKSGWSSSVRQTPRSAGLTGFSGGGGGSDRESVGSRGRRCKPRKPSGSPLYKKRNLDYTDYAHREAVNRLKYLLAESYTPVHSRKPSVTGAYHHHLHQHHKHEDSDDTDAVSVVERPVISEISKYLPRLSGRYSSLKKFPTTTTTPYDAYKSSPFKKEHDTKHSGGSTYGGAAGGGGGAIPSVCVTHPTESSHIGAAAAPPPEILNFIEKQEGYIEQLERESHFCREELNNLLGKVKDVISENETLTDHARAGHNRASAHPPVDSTDSSDTNDHLSKSGPKKSKPPLSGPNIVFESRISELEAQLAQSVIDLKRVSEENDLNKRKIAGGSVDAGCSEAYKRQLDNLHKDKDMLEDTVRKMQHTIDELKKSDASNYTRSQRTRDLAEQNAFERAQADMEIKRLKEELERQHDRVRDIQQEMAKKVSEERSLAERRYNYQVDQLGGDLSSQWEVASRLHLEVERQKRMENDYRRDLAQKNAVIEDLRSEIKAKTAALLSDMAQVNAEKQSLEQEITSLRLQLERAERQNKVDTSRLNAEVMSLRQRLDRADADLLHSRRENLRLVDQIASLEKEINLGDLNRETRPSKELNKLMADMEAKHVATVTDLEGMVQGQKQLMEKLTAECKELTNKLDETSAKHKLEREHLRQTNVDLMERLRQLWSSYKQRVPSITMPNADTNRRTYTTDSSSSSAPFKPPHRETRHTSSNASTHQNTHQPSPQTPLATPETHSLLEMNQSPQETPREQSAHLQLPKTNPRPKPKHTKSNKFHQVPQKPSSMSPTTSSNCNNSTQRKNSIRSRHSHPPSIQSSRPQMPSSHQPIRPTPLMAPSKHNQTSSSNSSCTIQMPSTTSSSTSNRDTMPTTALPTIQPHSTKTSTTVNPDTISNNTTSSNTSSPNTMPTTVHHSRSSSLSSPRKSTGERSNPHSQATQNRVRATELWGRSIRDSPLSHQQQQMSPSHHRQAMPNFCRNSLPRCASDWNVFADADASNISFDLVPSISISSPSLFDSCEEDISSATTVHRMF